jgi:hypothetical protein
MWGMAEGLIALFLDLRQKFGNDLFLTNFDLELQSLLKLNNSSTFKLSEKHFQTSHIISEMKQLY